MELQIFFIVLYGACFVVGLMALYIILTWDSIPPLHREVEPPAPKFMIYKDAKTAFNAMRDKFLTAPKCNLLGPTGTALADLNIKGRLFMRVISRELFSQFEHLLRAKFLVFCIVLWAFSLGVVVMRHFPAIYF